MNKLSVEKLDVKGKRVLTRVDFNVPIKEGVVADDTRIRESLPTIRNIIERGGKLILMSHLGRPGGNVDAKLSLKPVAACLEKLLGKSVSFVGDCVGETVKQIASELKPGDVLLLENVRFHPEEELLHKYAKQDEATKNRIDDFVRALASLGDVYVNDAFGTAHRAHASTQGVTKYFSQNAAGLLMQKEIEYLSRALENPERPFVAILGGAKVSDKIKVVTHLLEKVDALLIGGAMAYTFLKSQGKPVGKSLVEEDQLQVAAATLEKASKLGKKLLLPVDHLVAAQFEAETPAAIVEVIPDDMMGLDIGPRTVQLYSDEIKKARTVVWNGPMGVFEKSAFANGTFEIAKALAASGALSIVGGGDSVSAVKKSGVSDRVSHISTGGGASLELLEGKELPGLTSLTEA
ncbi:MAG: phosphoglycerate kinase [Deltaproteobacteria bacterium]|nr:phosphoglycerate kinase [Deltaproteobacteria bacterium]